MTKFKVGDKVRLLAEGELFPVGEIGTVVEVFTDGDEPVYYVRFRPDDYAHFHNFGHHLDNELEPE
ncbi:hypothetical protein [Mycolicibacter icosiumassiliensis]|uniref:hypothetical protein n=1 Tax=Mycolicibacter icosiumassiliensis TaxID=1792835 RepID=UPI000829B8E4|nr:hypothetical protein [Mycolicibacter icosiumassiliensis]